MQTSATVIIGADGLPSSFRIWGFGDIDTEKGTFKLSKASAGQVLKRAEQWGNEFPIDWGHAMLDSVVVDPAESGKAAGWFTPQLKDDGLWAVAVSWTPLAQKKLNDREFRYFSPAFSTEKDGTIVGLTNIALTNLPATRDMNPLVADAKEHAVDPVLKKFLEDMQASIQAGFNTRMEALTTSIAAVRTQVEAVKPAAGAAAAATTVVTLSSAALDAIADETPEAKRAFKAEIHKLSGQTTTSAALGVILGWKAAADGAAAKEAELVTLRAKVGDSEVERVIAAAEKEGKVTPATRPALVEMGKKDLATLTGYLSVAPRIAPGARTEPIPPGGAGAGGGGGGGAGGGTTELTPEDKHVAALLGTTDLASLSKRKGELGELPRLQ